LTLFACLSFPFELKLCCCSGQNGGKIRFSLRIKEVSRCDLIEPQLWRAGGQFASAAFTDKSEAAGVRTSMDGRGRWLDNVFVDRLHSERPAPCQPQTAT
jgi:hypothetical protein